MNRSGTDSPRPSETSRATHEESLAIDRLTIDARELPLVNRERRPLNSFSGLRKPARLPRRRPQRLFSPSSAHHSLAVVAKSSETSAMPLSSAPHSPADVALPFMRTSLAESLSLGRDASFSQSVCRTKTPDDPRTSTSIAGAHSQPSTAPRSEKVGADPIREAHGSALGGISRLTWA